MLCTYCSAETTDAFLCKNCVATLDELLSVIPGLLAELNVTMSRQARMTERLGGRSAETPMPYHVAAATAYRELTDELTTVARRFVYTPKGVLILRQGGPQARVAFLRSVLALIVKHPLSGTTLTTFRELTSKAREIIDHSGQSLYIGVCSHEGCEVDLYGLEGAATVTCWKCSAGHDVAARRDVLMDALDDVLATATEIGRAVQVAGNPVKPATIWQWRRRGRIEVRGTTAQGAPLYRIGDVMALARHQST